MERAGIWALIAAGMGPWLLAIRANRQTSLKFAVAWAAAAWWAWGAALSTDSVAATYAALTMSGCAGVAVLGARQPGAAAWNFVVVGLLAILLLPLGEGAVTGAVVQLDTIRTGFLTALLGTVIVNYLPTRLWPAAVAFGLGAGLTVGRVAGAGVGDFAGRNAVANLSILCVPWLALALLWRARPAELPVNRLWFAFRDRFGAIWSLRVREQFNRSAANSGSPRRLAWRGVASPKSDDLDRLSALLSRFGMAGHQKPGLVMPAAEPTPLRPGD